MHRIGLLIAILHTLVSDEQHLRQQWADTFFESVCAQLAEHPDTKNLHKLFIWNDSAGDASRVLWMLKGVVDVNFTVSVCCELLTLGASPSYLRLFKNVPLVFSPDNLDDAKYVHAAICAGSWDANNRPVWMWLAGRSSELFGSGSIADFLRDFMKQPEWSSLSDGARQEFCAGVASVCMQPGWSDNAETLETIRELMQAALDSVANPPESSLDVVSGRMTLPGDVYKSVVHPAPG